LGGYKKQVFLHTLIVNDLHTLLKKRKNCLRHWLASTK